MKRVCVIGHFGFGENMLNGQTVKTKIVTDELKKQLGSNQVSEIDTHGGLKAYLRLPFELFCALKDHRNIVILPAHNGVRVIAPLLWILNKLFKRRLHYVVIGGWLPDLIKNKPLLSRVLKQMYGIYVETEAMKVNLEGQGFRNIYKMPNCKNLTILKPEELIYSQCEPYKLCTFSRVMKEKGIEDAIYAVNEVNRQSGRIVYELDIYGQIESEQQEWFEDITRNLPQYINYKGLVEYNNSVQIIKKYFALLFPTRFYTEGIPGTIIDAYAAGVPVISSKWESFSDIVDDGKTGIGYVFDDRMGLTNILIMLANNPENANKMKVACLLKANNYSPSKVVQVLWGGYKGIKIKYNGNLVYISADGEQLPAIIDKRIKVCTFSRVMKEKGIEEAIEAVKIANNKLGKCVFELDIYGQIDPDQSEWFLELKRVFPEYITYKGIIPFDQSTEVLKEYHCIIFVTYYDGEGFPGTLLDAMYSGLPAIVSDWRYNTEIAKETWTRIVPVHDSNSIANILVESCCDIEAWNNMKVAAIREAEAYNPQKVLKTLVSNLLT